MLKRGILTALLIASGAVAGETAWQRYARLQHKGDVRGQVVALAAALRSGTAAIRPEDELRRHQPGLRWLDAAPWSAVVRAAHPSAKRRSAGIPWLQDRPYDVRMVRCKPNSSNFCFPVTPRSFYGGLIPWAKISDLENADGIVRKTEETITPEGLRAIGDRIFLPGTILLAMYGSVGKTGIAGVRLSTNQAILGITPRADHLDPRFLRRWLDSKASMLLSGARGVAQANISKTIVESLPIPIPTLAEQQRIANILERVDALRAKRREALAKVETVVGAVFDEMFVRSANEHWPITEIAALGKDETASIRTGPFGSQLLHGEFTDRGIAVLGIDNVVTNEFAWAQRRFIAEQKYAKLRRYTVQPGDVLITIMGTIGRCAVVPNDIPLAINTKHLCCITLDQKRCLPKFLHAYFLRHPIARQHLTKTAKGAIMDGLNMGIIKAMPVSLPPVAIQKEFVERVFAIDNLKQTHRDSLAQLDALFASLQHRAFRGELCWSELVATRAGVQRSVGASGMLTSRLPSSRCTSTLSCPSGRRRWRHRAGPRRTTRIPSSGGACISRDPRISSGGPQSL